MRGVDVRILIPSRRDHRVVFAASRLYAYDLVQAGVRIFRYKPGFLHQKVVLVDDIAASIGSANLDNRSFRLNFEITVLTVDRAFASEVEIDAARRLRAFLRDRQRRLSRQGVLAAHGDARRAAFLADPLSAPDAQSSFSMSSAIDSGFVCGA